MLMYFYRWPHLMKARQKSVYPVGGVDFYLASGLYYIWSSIKITLFLDLAVAKSLQSTRTVTDDAAAADADVLTTTGYTC